MPGYKKSGYGYKRSSKRRSFKKSKSSRKVSASTKRYVKSVISRNIENKCLLQLTTKASSSFNTTWAFVRLTPDFTSNNTPEGGVVGAKVRQKEFEIKGGVVNSVPCFARMIVFQWHPNILSDAPQAIEMFENSLTPNIWSLFQTRSNRFTVMMDKTFVIQPNITNAVTQKFVSKKWKLNSIMKNDEGASNNSGSFTNHIYVAYVSDQTVTLPEFTWFCRLKYQDA